jgi:hypothetical protein
MKKESQLREEWSLSKEELANHRKEAPEGFVVKEPSARPERLWGYAWTAEGQGWLADRLKVKTVSVVNIEPVKETESKDGIFECKVLRSGFANVRLIEVEHNGKTLRATCRTNVNIKPRAIVKVKIVGNSACVTEITKKHLIKNSNG